MENFIFCVVGVPKRNSEDIRGERYRVRCCFRKKGENNDFYWSYALEKYGLHQPEKNHSNHKRIDYWFAVS